MAKRAAAKGKTQVITIVLQSGLSVQLVNATKKGIANLSFTDENGGTLTMNVFDAKGAATTALTLFNVNGR